jgi:transcription initiation factor TFIID subunit 3
MTTTDLHTALLRPAILQILRATGFNHAKPHVIDTLTDLTARYLSLLSTTTAQTAFNLHNSPVPTIQDVRIALSSVGALTPQMSTAEEELKGEVEIVEAGVSMKVPFEDLRGVENFANWATGSANREIRRIAGFGEDGAAGANVEEIAAGLEDEDDYLDGKSGALFWLMLD